MKTLQSNPVSRAFLLWSLLTALLLSSTGCVAILAGGAGAGAVAYVRGEAKGNVNASVDRTAQAVSAVVSEMNLNLIQSTSDEVSAEFTARTADDKRVRINLASAGNNITEVRVRIGTFGDETLSRDIFNRIEARL